MFHMIMWKKIVVLCLKTNNGYCVHAATDLDDWPGGIRQQFKAAVCAVSTHRSGSIIFMNVNRQKCVYMCLFPYHSRLIIIIRALCRRLWWSLCCANSSSYQVLRVRWRLRLSMMQMRLLHGLAKTLRVFCFPLPKHCREFDLWLKQNRTDCSCLLIPSGQWTGTLSLILDFSHGNERPTFDSWNLFLGRMQCSPCESTVTIANGCTRIHRGGKCL